jgi:hypothetical protein
VEQEKEEEEERIGLLEFYVVPCGCKTVVREIIIYFLLEGER